MQRELEPLTTIPFITCLVLLIVNDFWLKDQFHNVVTGKLSDFCGLFIFSIFWSVLFPKRKQEVFFFTALFFVYWKSPYSNTFIEVFSEHLYPIARVIDLSDLLALTVLPAAWLTLTSEFWTIRVNQSIIALLTLFSFCATSVARPIQRFDQPQYVLYYTFQTQLLVNQYQFEDQEVEFYKQGNLLAVKVTELWLEGDWPAKEDDFQKNVVLKGLDKKILANLDDSVRSLLKTPVGNNTLTIESANYKDIASFKESRLHGKFQRKRNDGTLLIEGWYKNGIEDSVWTLRDSITDKVIKKTFINGETVRKETFKAGRSVSLESVNTRKESVRNKYFHLAFLIVLASGCLLLIIRNYKAVYPEEVQFSVWSKLFLPLVLPPGVFFLHLQTSELIPDSHSGGFEFLGDVFLIYVCSVPLFLVVFFVIRIRKNIDILWYCVLFASLYTLWQEVIQLERLCRGLV